jgi:hypothetical protein
MSFGMLVREVWSILTNVSQDLAASVAILMFYQTTQCNIPADSHLYTHCRENLKSQQVLKQSPRLRKDSLTLQFLRGYDVTSTYYSAKVCKHLSFSAIA